MTSPPRSAPQEATHPNQSRTEVPCYDSRTLFGDGRRVIIFHQGENYQLQMTRQGKLILTK